MAAPKVTVFLNVKLVQCDDTDEHVNVLHGVLARDEPSLALPLHAEEFQVSVGSKTVRMTLEDQRPTSEDAKLKTDIDPEVVVFVFDASSVAGMEVAERLCKRMVEAGGPIKSHSPVARPGSASSTGDLSPRQCSYVIVGVFRGEDELSVCAEARQMQPLGVGEGASRVEVPCKLLDLKQDQATVTMQLFGAHIEGKALHASTLPRKSSSRRPKSEKQKEKDYLRRILKGDLDAASSLVLSSRPAATAGAASGASGDEEGRSGGTGAAAAPPMLPGDAAAPGASARVAELESTVKTLTADKAAKQAAIDELNAKLSDLEASNASLLAQEATLQARLAESTEAAHALEAVRSQAASKDEVVEALTAKRAALETQVAEVQGTLAIKTAELEDANAQVSHLKTQLETATSTATSSADEVGSLATKLAAAEATVTQLEAKNNALEEQASALVTEQIRLKGALEEAQSAQESANMQLKVAQEMLDARVAETTRLDNELAEAKERTAADLRQKHVEIQDLRHRMASMADPSVVAELTERTRLAEESLQAKHNRLVDMERKFEKSQADQRASVSNTHKLQQSLKGFIDKQVHDLAEKVSTLTERLQIANDEADDARDRLRELREELFRSQQEFKMKETQSEQLQDDVKQLQAELAAKTVALRRAEDEVAAQTALPDDLFDKSERVVANSLDYATNTHRSQANKENNNDRDCCCGWVWCGP